MSDMTREPRTSGIQLLQSGNFQAAREQLLLATQQNPSDGLAYGYLGIAQARLGDMQGAIGSLHEAARLQPRDPMAFYNLAVALLQAARNEEARTALEYALQLDPSHTKSRAALASLTGAAHSATTPSSSVPANTVYDLPSTATAIPPLPEAITTGWPGGASPPSAPAPAVVSNAIQGPAPNSPGLVYRSDSSQRKALHRFPNTGERLLRGLGWGALVGQWWTLLNVFWAIVWQQGGKGSAAHYAILAIIMAILFAVAGSITGLVIGGGNANVQAGSMIGLVVGLLLMGGEFLLSGNNGSTLVNIFFWAFTGRFVGAHIAARVQRPILV